MVLVSYKLRGLVDCIAMVMHCLHAGQERETLPCMGFQERAPDNALGAVKQNPLSADNAWNPKMAGKMGPGVNRNEGFRQGHTRQPLGDAVG